MALEVPTGIPEEARLRFAELLGEPLLPPETLLREIEECLGLVRRVVMEGAPLDVPWIEEVAMRARGLVRRLGPATPEPERRMIQAAVRYFVLSDDAEGDLVSLLGFDDDARVIEAVEQRLDG